MSVTKYIVILLIIFNSCKQVNKKPTNFNKLNNDSTDHLKKHIEKKDSIAIDKDSLVVDKGSLVIENEFDELLIDQVKINKSKFNIKYNKLLSKETDSIIAVSLMANLSWECGIPFNWDEESVKIIYTQGKKYLTNGDDSVLYYINLEGFKNKLTISKNNIVLNNNTTINDFKKYFSKCEIIKNNTGYVIYNITFNPLQPEDKWIFYFNKKGFLIEVYLDWWMC